MDPLRILLVEDEADTAHSTALLLRFHGHDVSVAGDGLAALELAHTNPDVVLLDIGLPGLDGYSVAEQLVENEMKPPVVIAVTGYPPRKATGIHLHLVKPIDVNELACVLGRVQERLLASAATP